jgi:hypothetical protein
MGTRQVWTVMPQSVAAFLGAALIAAQGQAQSISAGKRETPHLEFVTEYIRQLAAIEDIREAGERELTGDSKTSSPFTAVIHNGTAMQLELRSQISMLQKMRLAAPFDTVIPLLAEFDKKKIDLYQRIVDISSVFLVEKPGVDYAGLAAEMPKVRAGLEYIDRTIFEDVTPLVFATLLDQRPDSDNHVSHLIITKAESARLVESLNNRFGPKLDKKEPGYIVGSAAVLRTYLLDGHKSSDEPWE